jgi:hypothetical protein
LYAEHANPLRNGPLRDLEVLAGLVTHAVLAMQSGMAPGELGWSISDAVDHHAVVHQAVGMVAMQLECSPIDSLARRQARAFADGVGVEAVARQVVSRKLRFD